MPRSITPFLMFEGNAFEAVSLYVSLFKRSAILKVERWEAGEPGAEGSVKRVNFTLAGTPVIALDSPVKHSFTFTPSISLFVECESETELEEAYTLLSTGGEILMPLDNYGFSRQFGWVNDRFGVSWQLNLA
jgi:predicted 3-demethylubiquinone-9 3-methyltransferase (glyoxalase superfamily)